MKELCSYGCGKEAIIQFKNGKFCCCKKFNSCTEFVKTRKSLKGKKREKVNREKPELCSYGCGKEAHYYLKWVNKWCCENEWRNCPTNLKKMKEGSNSRKGVIPWNKGKKQTEKQCSDHKITMIKKWSDPEFRQKQEDIRTSKTYREKQSRLKTGIGNPNYGKPIHKNTLASLINTVEKIKNKYPTFYEIETPIEEDGVIKIRCKYCNKLFEPTHLIMYERIRQVERGNGKGFMYCCEEHKYLCPFSHRVSSGELTEYIKYNRIVWKETRKSIKNNKDKITNISFRGYKFGTSLDHKYSIKMGFKNNIDPKIIGHWKNLEIITFSDNCRKNMNCTISLEKLLKEIR